MVTSRKPKGPRGRPRLDPEEKLRRRRLREERVLRSKVETGLSQKRLFLSASAVQKAEALIAEGGFSGYTDLVEFLLSAVEPAAKPGDPAEVAVDRQD